jgi:hypothetical protein
VTERARMSDPDALIRAAGHDDTLSIRRRTSGSRRYSPPLAPVGWGRVVSQGAEQADEVSLQLVRLTQLHPQVLP